jgi:hypothetical protein
MTSTRIGKHPDLPEVDRRGYRAVMSHFQRLSMDSIDGNPVDFEQFKGQVNLVVNVASR